MTDLQPEGQKPASGGFSLDIIELLVFGLGRHRYWIVTFGVLGLLVGTYFSIAVPNRFQSGGKFLVKFGRLEQATPESVAGLNTGRPTALTISDELQILRSDTTFKQAANELGAAYVLQPPEDPTAGDGPGTPLYKRKMHELQRWLWFGSKGPRTTVQGEEGEEVELTEEDMESPKALAAAARRLQLGTRFSSSRQSSIIGVEYKDFTPERAQVITQKIMEMCQWRHTQVFSGMLSPQYLDGKLENALREEDVRSDQFQQHTEECGFFDLAGRKQEVLKTIGELEEKIADDELRLKEIEKELPTVEQELTGIEAKVVQLYVPPQEENPKWLDLTRRIAEKNKELERLQMNFKPDSRQYLEGKSTIESVIQLYEQELAGVEHYYQPDPYDKPVDNPLFVSLSEEKRKLEQERERSTTGREARIERLAGKRLELQAILDCEPIHRAMQGDIGRATSLVRQYTNAKEENERLRAVSTEKEASNLVIVQTPPYLPTKVSPQRSKNIVTGLGMGFAIGAAFAVLRQFLDSRLRFPRTAKRVVGAKVLGVVPEVRSWRTTGKKLRKGHAA